MESRKKYKYWTPGEIRMLGELYSKGTPGKEIAAILERPLASIQQKASNLGMRTARKRGEWRKIKLTRDQKLWMRLNYPHMSDAIISIYLGLNIHAVRRLADELKLSKTEQYIRESRSHASKTRWSKTDNQN